jgi:F420-dependent oxidoreductase-like protein
MIQFLLQVSSYSFENRTDEHIFDHLISCALAAEQAGFDYILPVDHFYQIPVNGPRSAPMLESYVVASAIASHTTRVGVGTLVTGVTYRNPAHLAKIVTTLDHVSHGRAVLGIGAAWNDVEHRAYGFTYPALRERFEMLEEAVAICRLMFREEHPSYEGNHYRIEEALNFPRPIQPGGPRIIIGGSGEKRTLRLVAKYGDVCNLLPCGPDEARHKFGVLESHCQVEGRDYAEILRTCAVGLILHRDKSVAEASLEQLVRMRVEGSQQMRLGHPGESIRASVVAGNPESVAEELQRYLEAGVQGFAFSNFYLQDPQSFELVGELIALMRGASQVNEVWDVERE